MHCNCTVTVLWLSYEMHCDCSWNDGRLGDTRSSAAAFGAPSSAARQGRNTRWLSIQSANSSGDAGRVIPCPLLCSIFTSGDKFRFLCSPLPRLNVGVVPHAVPASGQCVQRQENAVPGPVAVTDKNTGLRPWYGVRPTSIGVPSLRKSRTHYDRIRKDCQGQEQRYKTNNGYVV